MFNDVLRKPLVTLLLGAENAQILSPCKESILKSCSAAYSGLLTRQYISHLVKFYGPEKAFHWRNPVPWDWHLLPVKIMQSAIGLEIYFNNLIEANLCTLRAR